MPQWLQDAIEEAKTLSKGDAIQAFVSHIGDYLTAAEDVATALRQVGRDLHDSENASVAASAITAEPAAGSDTGSADTGSGGTQAV